MQAVEIVLQQLTSVVVFGIYSKQRTVPPPVICQRNTEHHAKTCSSFNLFDTTNFVSTNVKNSPCITLLFTVSYTSLHV